MAGRAKSTNKTNKKTSKSGSGSSSRSSTRKSTPAKSSRTTSRKPTSTTARAPQAVFTLTQDQKQSILGIFLLVTAILTLISIFTPNAGSLPNWWAGVLFQGFGWGAYLFPILLFSEAPGFFFCESRRSSLKLRLPASLGLLYSSSIYWHGFRCLPIGYLGRIKLAAGQLAVFS